MRWLLWFALLSPLGSGCGGPPDISRSEANPRKDAIYAYVKTLVEEDGFGNAHPFSCEKLSPVLAIYKANDFTDAARIAGRIYEFQGAGHSVSLHSRNEDQARTLGLSLKVCRVIVNQAHAIATGGSFDNGLPFSLSMGCGTWGGNSFSENMTYRNYLNITRIARPIAEVVPSVEDVLGAYVERYGA